MATVGGPIQSIQLAGRILPVAADADAKRKLGGYSNKIEQNGDGSARIIKMIEPWELSDITVSCDDVRGDQEFLKGLAARKDYFPCLITLASGTDYSGKGILTDVPEFSTANSTAKISLQGPGDPGLEKQ